MTDYKGQITMDMVKRELSVLLLMCKISTVALQSSIQALQKMETDCPYDPTITRAGMYATNS